MAPDETTMRLLVAMMLMPMESCTSDAKNIFQPDERWHLRGASHAHQQNDTRFNHSAGLHSSIEDDRWPAPSNDSDPLYKRDIRTADPLARMGVPVIRTEGLIARRSPSITKRFTIFSRCSQFKVRVKDGRVDALGDFDSPFVHLKAESMDGQMRLQSVHSNDFICFNAKGKLIVKSDGEDGRCYFHETLSSDYYVEFRSASNPSWLMGFRRDGKPLRGSPWRDNNKVEEKDGEAKGGRRRKKTKAKKMKPKSWISSSEGPTRQRKHKAKVKAAESRRPTEETSPTLATTAATTSALRSTTSIGEAASRGGGQIAVTLPGSEGSIDPPKATGARRHGIARCYQFVKVSSEREERIKFALLLRRKRRLRGARLRSRVL